MSSDSKANAWLFSRKSSLKIPLDCWPCPMMRHCTNSNIFYLFSSLFWNQKTQIKLVSKQEFIKLNTVVEDLKCGTSIIQVIKRTILAYSTVPLESKCISHLKGIQTLLYKTIYFKGSFFPVFLNQIQLSSCPRLGS